MFRKTMIVMTLALSLSAACKADDASTKPEATEVAEPVTNGAATSPESQPTETQTNQAADGTFGELVTGATAVKVTRRAEDGSPGEERTADAEWMEKFVAAVGPEQPGSAGVPRCLPQYTITFQKGETELASFGAVCASEAESVTLVRDGAGYAATDGPATTKMLSALFAAE